MGKPRVTNPVLARTTPNLELEVIRLDSQRRLDLELVLGVSQLDVEALEDQRPGGDHLLLGDGPARAGPRTGPEGLPRVLRVLLPPSLEEALRPELVGIGAVDAGVVVQPPEVQQDCPVRLDLVFTANHGLALAVALEGRDGA